MAKLIDPSTGEIKLPDPMAGFNRKYGKLLGIEKPKPTRLTAEDMTALSEVGAAKDLGTLDERTAFSKVMDVLEIGHDAVANVIAEATGTPTLGKPTGTFGAPKVYMSDVLRRLGVKNDIVAGVGGFVGDLVIDPLTYLGGAGAGKAVGLKVASNVPRFLGAGTKLIRGAGKAMAKGAKPSAELARALGKTPEALAKAGATLTAKYIKRGLSAEEAASQVAAKLGGGKHGAGILGERIGRAVKTLKTAPEAQTLAVKYGSKGAPIIHLPFTEYALRAPIGAQAKLYRTFKTGTDIPKLAEMEALGTTAKAGKVAAQKLEEATVSQRSLPPLIGRALRVQRRQGGRAAARLAAYKAGPEAPAAVKYALAGEIGALHPAQIDPHATWFQKMANAAARFMQKAFGAPASKMTRIEAGAASRKTAEAVDAEARTVIWFRKTATPAIKQIAAAKGWTQKETSRRLYNLVEYPDAKARAALHPTDAVLAELPETEAAFGAAGVNLTAEARGVYGEIHAGLRARNVAPGVIPYYQKRVTTEAMAKAAGPKEGQAARLMQDPFAEHRVQRVEYTLADGTKGTVFGRPGDKRLAKLEGLERNKKATLQRFEVSTEQQNQWQAVPGKPLRGVAIPFKGPHFEQDTALSLGAAAKEAQQRHAAGDIRDFARKFISYATEAEYHKDFERFGHMVPVSAALEHYRDTPFWAYVGEQLTKAMGKRKAVIPQQIADMLQRQATIWKKPEELGTFLRLSDKYLFIWKGVTLMHPAYTARNVVQDNLGLWSMGASLADVHRLIASAEFRDAINAAAKGESLAGKFITLSRLGRLPADEIIRSAKAYNMLNAGFSSIVADPSRWAAAKSMLGRAGRKWFEWNNDIENHYRMAGFLHFMDQGMSAREAALRTIRAMPDLTDLTLFEREFGRRFFPWYAWMRKNGSNMLKLLSERPNLLAGTDYLRHAGETAIQGEDMVPPELRPEWMSESQSVQIMGDKDAGTVFLITSWLPFDDVMNLFESTQSPGEFFRGLLSKMRPDAKFIAEMGIGQDIFKRKPSEPFSTIEAIAAIPAAMAGRSHTPLDNLLAIRPVKEAIRTGVDIEGVAPRLTRALLGGAMQPVTRLGGLLEDYKQLTEKAKTFRSTANRAAKAGKTEEARAAAKRWIDVQARMAEAGLPGPSAKIRGFLTRLGKPAKTGALDEQRAIAQ